MNIMFKIRPVYAADAGGTPPTPPPSDGAVTPPWGPDVNKTWMTGEGANAKPWYETLLPDGPTKDLYKQKGYPNPVAAADAYFSANRMISGSAVELPAEDAKPEVWDAFHTKMGRPAKAEEYKFSFGKTPDGKDAVADPNMIKFGQELAFESGMSPKRAQAMVDKWQKFVTEQNTAYNDTQKTANDNEVLAFKAKAGESFDSDMSAGKRAVQALGLEDTTLQKIEGAIGASAMLELFTKLGKKSAEGGLVGSDQGGEPGNINLMSAAQAKATIEMRRADPQFAAKLENKDHPQHAAATEEMNKLYAKAGSLVD